MLSPTPLNSVFVATPAYGGMVHARYVDSLLGLQHQLLNRGIGFRYIHASASGLIQLGRNLMADMFLKSDCSHMLFVDSDMGFDAAAIRLFDYPEIETMGVVYPRKRINWARVAYHIRAQPDLSPEALAETTGDYSGMVEFADPNFAGDLTEPVEVLGVGTGLMLIARSAFERLDASGTISNLTVGRGQPTFASYFDASSDENGVFLSEDITFCRRLRAVGGRIYALTSLRTIHVGNYEFVGNLTVPQA